jgi:hypothetical protein
MELTQVCSDADLSSSLVGAAVLVADRGDGKLAGFVEIGSRTFAEACTSSVERQICFRKKLR